MEGIAVGLVLIGLIGMVIVLIGAAIEAFGLITTLGLLTLVTSTFIIISLIVICIDIWPYTDNANYWEWYW